MAAAGGAAAARQVTPAGGGRSAATSRSGAVAGPVVAVPKLFVCPITLELMQEPTITACGHMFEREAILDWIRSGKNPSSKHCPVCNQAIAENQLSPCYPIKTAIQDWVQNQAASPATTPIPTQMKGPSKTGTFKIGFQFRKVVTNLFSRRTKEPKPETFITEASTGPLTRVRSRSSSLGSQRTTEPSRFPSGNGVVWAHLHPLSRNYEAIEIYKDNYTIGRSAQADHMIARSEISGKHCDIYRVAMEPSAFGYTPNGFNYDVFLIDTSSNGTYVNGRRPGKGDPVGLRNGDEISLGNRFTSQEKPELNSFIDWIFLGSMKSSPQFQQIERLKTAVADFDELLTLSDSDLQGRGIESTDVRSKVAVAAKAWNDEHQLPVYRFVIIGMEPPARRPSNPTQTMMATMPPSRPPPPGVPPNAPLSYTQFSVQQQKGDITRASTMPVSSTSILPPSLGPPPSTVPAAAPRIQSQLLLPPVIAEEEFDVGFFPSTYMAHAEQRQVVLTLRRIGPVTVPLTVLLSTTDNGTARAGVDYSPLELTPVTFPVGACDISFKFDWAGMSQPDPTTLDMNSHAGILTVNFAVFRTNGELMPATELTEPTAVLIVERKTIAPEDEAAKLRRISLASNLSNNDEMVSRMATVFSDVSIATIHGVIRHEQRTRTDADPSQIQDAVVSKLLWYQSLDEPAPGELDNIKTLFGDFPISDNVTAVTETDTTQESSTPSSSSSHVPRWMRPVNSFGEAPPL